MRVSFKVTKKPDRTMKRLQRLAKGTQFDNLEGRASAGTRALAQATPVDSSQTANSWSHTVEKGRNGARITWYNSNVEAGVPIAILLQYGHATGTGGWVEGRDFINPALKPHTNDMKKVVWKAVTN